MALLQWHTLTKPDGSALVHSANPTIRLHGNPYYRSEVGFSEFTANCSISDVPPCEDGIFSLERRRLTSRVNMTAQFINAAYKQLPFISSPLLY